MENLRALLETYIGEIRGFMEAGNYVEARYRVNQCLDSVERHYPWLLSISWNNGIIEGERLEEGG